MKIRPLNNLISGLTGYGADTQTTQQTTTIQQNQQSKVAGEDAASVDVATGSKGSASERAQYIASLKEQVQNGSYEIDSQKVAQALYNDLF